MQDEKIVELYWQRSDEAIRETEKKFGAYCRTIAYNILQNGEDSEECVNDTWLGAWNSMPDRRPARLAPYLGRITRNLSLNRALAQSRKKRGGGEFAVALEELGDCVPSDDSPEKELERRELNRAISNFVAALPETERRVFLARYWYFAGVDDIAARLGFTHSKVASMLSRTRRKLKTQLTEEGLC